MTDFNELKSDSICCAVSSHGNSKFAYVCTLPECTKTRFMCNHCWAETHKEHQRFAMRIEDIFNGRAAQSRVRFEDSPEGQELSRMMGLNEKNYLIFKRSFDKTIKDMQDYFTKVSFNLNQIVLGLKNRCLQLAHDKFAENPLAQLYDYYYYFQSGGELKNIIENHLRLVHDEATTSFLLSRYFNSYQRDEDVVVQLRGLFEEMVTKEEKIFDDIRFDPKCLDDLFAPLFHSLETVDSRKTLLTKKIQSYAMPTNFTDSVVDEGCFFNTGKAPKRRSDRPTTPKKKIFEPSKRAAAESQFRADPDERVASSAPYYSPRYKPYTDKPIVQVNERPYIDQSQFRSNQSNYQKRPISPLGNRNQAYDPSASQYIPEREHFYPPAYESYPGPPPPNYARSQVIEPPIPKNRALIQQDGRMNGAPDRRPDKTTSQYFRPPQANPRRPPQEYNDFPQGSIGYSQPPRTKPNDRQESQYSPNLRPQRIDPGHERILKDLDLDEPPQSYQAPSIPNHKKSPSRTKFQGPLSNLYEAGAPPPVYHPTAGKDEVPKEISPIISPRETVYVPYENQGARPKSNLQDNVYHDSYDPKNRRRLASPPVDEQDILVVKETKRHNKRMQTEPELFNAVDLMNSNNTTVIKASRYEKPSRNPDHSQQTTFYPPDNSHHVPARNPNPKTNGLFSEGSDEEMATSGPLGRRPEKTQPPETKKLNKIEIERPTGGFKELFQSEPPKPFNPSESRNSKSQVSNSRLKDLDESKGPQRGRTERKGESPDRDRDRSISASGLSVILADNNSSNYFSVRSRDNLIKISKTIICSTLIYLLPHEKRKGDSEMIVCLGDSEESLMFFGEKANFLGILQHCVNSGNPSIMSFISEESPALSGTSKTFLLSLTPKSSLLIINPQTMTALREVSIGSNTPGFSGNSNLLTNVIILQLKQDPKTFPNKTKTMPDPLIITSDTQKSLKVWDWNKSTRIFETFHDSEFTCINLMHLPRRNLSLLKLPNTDRYDFFTLALTTSKNKKLNFWSFTSEKPVYNFPCQFGGSIMSVVSPTMTYNYFDDGDSDAVEMRKEIVERFAHLLLVYTTDRDIYVLNWMKGEVNTFCSDVHKGAGIYDCTFWLNMKPVIDSTEFLFITVGDDPELKVWRLSDEEDGMASLNLVQEVEIKNIPVGKNLNFLDSLITDEDNRLKMNLRLVCASVNSRVSLSGVVLKTIRILENV